MQNTRNRVIVITGATSGFGRGVALEFAEEGADIVLAGRRKDVLNEVAEECEHHGCRALVVQTDVSDRDDVERLAAQAIRRFGRIDVWINNAGVATFGRFDEVPLKEHEQVIATDLLGTIYGSHLALQQFRKQGEGILINVSSYVGKGSAPYFASYVSSKHGVRGLGMSLRQELEANEEADIHVCTVMPTSMDTPFFQHAGNHTGHPVVPIPPVYDPQQVVDAIVQLSHEPEGEVIVGQRGKIASVAGRIAPFAIEKKMAKQTHEALIEQKDTAPDSTGSLFKPAKVGTELRGGWLDSGSKSNNGLLAALAVGIPIALASLLLRRRGEEKLEVPVAA
jgi:short-subunit dehydrogenase